MNLSEGVKDLKWISRNAVSLFCLIRMLDIEGDIKEGRRRAIMVGSTDNVYGVGRP